tara:strand:- start:102 stop:527 length:426 start_codon:yes stop_codon:yes gene_type:complete
MKRSELKKIIKPIVKECIRESLLEGGVLSKVISEVMKGVGAQTQIVEAKAPVVPIRDNKKLAQKERQKLLETKRQMLDAIGKDAYNGVNIFEGTTPVKRAGSPGVETSSRGPLADVDPSDSGVDISSLMGNSAAWKQIVNS